MVYGRGPNRLMGCHPQSHGIMAERYRLLFRTFSLPAKNALARVQELIVRPTCRTKADDCIERRGRVRGACPPPQAESHAGGTWLEKLDLAATRPRPSKRSCSRTSMDSGNQLALLAHMSANRNSLTQFGRGNSQGGAGPGYLAELASCRARAPEGTER